jgi:hypothetical protein
VAGVRVTFSGVHSGASWSAGALLGIAQDGNRDLAAAQMSRNDTAPDPATFTALLQRAYKVQADALD